MLSITTIASNKKIIIKMAAKLDEEICGHHLLTLRSLFVTASQLINTYILY